MPRGSSLNKATVFGVRESKLYRLKGKPMRAMTSSSKAIEDKEHGAPKVEQLRGSWP
jgi:hypothetical protein